MNHLRVRSARRGEQNKIHMSYDQVMHRFLQQTSLFAFPARLSSVFHSNQVSTLRLQFYFSSISYELILKMLNTRDRSHLKDYIALEKFQNTSRF